MKKQVILWNLEDLTHKYAEHCIYIVNFSNYEIKWKTIVWSRILDCISNACSADSALGVSHVVLNYRIAEAERV